MLRKNFNFSRSENNDPKITTKEHGNSENEKEVNESILMLGDYLAVENIIPESFNLFANSDQEDQESTSGEEDVLEEEEIEKLNPNYVLFKAATAHNIPVMCQAISLGADKNWQNSENLNRTPLHQSIVVVCTIFYFLRKKQ
jgi:Arf-GAP with coiled-coil, ANK repeat and PH domain-containing protein